MIFDVDMAKLVLQGRKTQTRRLVTSPRCKYQTGKAYALQSGYGRPASGRITVMDVRLETVNSISLRDARREGFITRDEFLAWWRDRYGTPDRPAWVISFELGDKTDAPRLLPAARPAIRYRKLPPKDEKALGRWAIDDRARSDDSDLGYTENSVMALKLEAETISAAQANQYAKYANERHQSRGKDPDVLLRDELLRALEQWKSASDARTPDRDRLRTIRGIEHQIRMLDRKLKLA